MSKEVTQKVCEFCDGKIIVVSGKKRCGKHWTNEHLLGMGYTVLEVMEEFNN